MYPTVGHGFIINQSGEPEFTELIISRGHPIIISFPVIEEFSDKKDSSFISRILADKSEDNISHIRQLVSGFIRQTYDEKFSQ